MRILNFSTIPDCGHNETPTLFVPLKGIAIDMDQPFGADKWYGAALASYYRRYGTHPTPLQAAYIYNRGSVLNNYSEKARLGPEYPAETAIKSDYMRLLSTDDVARSYDLFIGRRPRPTPESDGVKYTVAFIQDALRPPVIYTLEMGGQNLARMHLARLVAELQRCALMADDYSDVGRADDCLI
jgi:hypothetical protein